MFYSIPFEPGKIIKGQEHSMVALSESVKRNVALMIRSKWPEECRALPGYGCLMRKYVLISQEKNETIQNLKTTIQKNIKESLKCSIEKHEKRLYEPNINVRFYTVIEDERKKESGGFAFETSPPFTYYLKISVKGKLDKTAKKLELIYEETMPLG